MKKYLEDIRRKTAGMNRRDKRNYIFTYYWYHMLGIGAAVGFLLFLIIHFGFGNDRPDFTCVMVNQEINYLRDGEMEQDFGEYTGMKKDRIVIDSDYNISYGSVQLEGVNESSYEKLFFKWNNKELDAVIMPESFYEYCRSLGGTFVNLDEMKTRGLPLYEDNGIHTGIWIDKTRFFDSWLENETGERFLLVFPTEGRHRDESQRFVDWIAEVERK